MKGCILYFSRSGQNYLNGEIVNLKTGNTKMLAEKIHELSRLPIYAIEPLETYPVDYQETIERAKKEKEQDTTVAFEANAPDLSDFDTILLGYPNWWGTFPQVIKTFLKENPLAEKKIFPFCTHEGSAFGSSLNDLKEICPKAHIGNGLPVNGSRINKADAAVENWLACFNEA